MKVVRVICVAIISGNAASDLGVPTRTAIAIGVLVGMLFITILEAGAWRDS